MSATVGISSPSVRSPTLRLAVAITALALAATAAAAPGKKLSYTMIDLGTLPGMTMTMSSFGGINQRGQVTGWSYFNHYADDSPFIWEKGVMIGLDTPAAVCGPQDINDHSELVGPYIEQGTPHAFFYGADGFVPLPDPEGTPGGAWAKCINNRGTIGGLAKSTEFAYTFGYAPVIWVDGQPQVLPVLDLGFAAPGGAVNDINDAGQMVGHSGGKFEMNPPCLRTHATLWEKGQPIDLGALEGHPSSMAFGINNAGVVVGHSGVASTGASRGFVWTKKTGMVELEMPSGWVSSWAVAINNRGDIVGGVSEAGDPQLGIPSEYGAPPIWPVTRLNHAVLWKDGQCIDLQDLVPADSPWNLHTAVAINARGQIVTWAAKLNDPPDPDDPYKDYIIHLILLDPTQ